MASCVWHKVAALSGVAAIAAGTYGSHGLKPKDPVYKTVWQTGNLYHLIHTSALLAAPLTKRPNLRCDGRGRLVWGVLISTLCILCRAMFGSLLTFGIVAFSGTLYVMAKTEDRKLGKLAPFGGMAFIAAWASLLF